MIIFGAVYSVSFLQDDNIPPYESYQVIRSNTWNFALKVINDREKAEKMRANIIMLMGTRARISYEIYNALNIKMTYWKLLP